MKSAHEIAKDARASLGSYCINTCKAQCCKRGYLLVKQDELDSLTDKKEEEYRKDEIVKDFGEKFLFKLDGKGCPKLSSDNLCTIHKNPNRPVLCNDYPLFLTRKYAVVASDCPGANEGLLNDYLKDLEGKGYKII